MLQTIAITKAKGNNREQRIGNDAERAVRVETTRTSTTPAMLEDFREGTEAAGSAGNRDFSSEAMA